MQTFSCLREDVRQTFSWFREEMWGGGISLYIFHFLLWGSTQIHWLVLSFPSLAVSNVPKATEEISLDSLVSWERITFKVGSCRVDTQPRRHKFTIARLRDLGIITTRLGDLGSKTTRLGDLVCSITTRIRDLSSFSLFICWLLDLG